MMCGVLFRDKRRFNGRVVKEKAFEVVWAFFEKRGGYRSGSTLNNRRGRKVSTGLTREVMKECGKNVENDG